MFKGTGGIMSQDEDNVCCSELLVVSCSDTEEHCHLICGSSKAVMSNDTIRTVCIGNFDKCVLSEEVMYESG